MTFGGKSMTKADRDRITAIKEGVCMACLQLGHEIGFPEAHHLLSGGRRIGHHATVGLCSWHHRAVVPAGTNHAYMRATLGPSLAEGSKPFHERFGSDVELLAQQNSYLGIEPNREAA